MFLFMVVREVIEALRIIAADGFLQSVAQREIIGIRYDGLKFRAEFAVVVDADVLERLVAH